MHMLLLKNVSGRFFKFRNGRSWGILILIMGCCCGSFAQAVSFVASVDKTEIALDEIFELSFTLNNASGSGLTPPSFQDFQVFSGPAVYTSTTIINGKVSQTNSYIYTLKPKRLGSITIGAAVIKSNNKYLETMPVTINVVRKTSPSPHINAGKETDCFIRAVPQVTQAYPGQQVALDYKVFRSVNIESATIVEEPDYKGFYKADLQDRERIPKEENIGGKRWLSQTMKRISLFPQQTGLLTIDPISIQLNIVTGSSDPFGFFGKTTPVIRASNATEVTVKSLPEGAPASFSGGVGQYQVEAALTTPKATTGDIISLHLTVQGNGDPKRVQAPDLVLPEGMEMYDVRVVDEQPGESQDQLVFTKRFEYLLKAKKAGDYQLQPAFSWFDPTDKRYHTWDEKSFTLRVEQGKASDPGTSTGTKKEAAPRKSFWRWDNVLIPVSLALLLTGIFIWYRFRRKANQPAADMLPGKGRQTKKHVRLALAYQQLKAGHVRAFYDALSKDLYDYAAAEYDLALADHSIEAVRERMQAAGVPAELVRDFTALLQNCEIALYAGSEAGGVAGMETAYTQAGNVLGQLAQWAEK